MWGSKGKSLEVCKPIEVLPKGAPILACNNNTKKRLALMIALMIKAIAPLEAATYRLTCDRIS